MGIKIGCPSLKLAFKRSANASKTRTGRAAGVAYEALDRRGQDKDIDHSRSAQNEVYGIQHAPEFLRMLREEVDAYSEQRKASGGRAVRDTASVGFAIVLKPPAEYVTGLSEDDRDRFMWDLWESFRVATADYMAPDAVKSLIKHKDEQGDHWHVLGIAKTPTGELSADKVICPKLWSALNRKLPAEMRQRGWQVDECINYDPEEAAQMSAPEKAAYTAKCAAKRVQGGRSSAEYKAEQTEKKLQAVEAENERLRQELARAQAEKALEAPQRPSEGKQGGRGMYDLDRAFGDIMGPSGASDGYTR